MEGIAEEAATPAPGSIAARILLRLYAMPAPVRGISEVMLTREFGAPAALRELCEAGLVRSRGWDNLRQRMPDSIWVLTEAGERVAAAIALREEGS